MITGAAAAAAAAAAFISEFWNLDFWIPRVGKLISIKFQLKRTNFKNFINFIVLYCLRAKITLKISF